MYITDAELQTLYPQAADYDVVLRTEVLTQADSLVDSFLLTSLKPLITKNYTNGKYPAVLKICSVQFCRYLLELSNNGWSEELQSLYDNTANILSKVTENELNVPGVNVQPKDTGWEILSLTTSSLLLPEVRGSVPSVEQKWTLIFNDDSTYNGTRDDNVQIIVSQSLTYDWQWAQRNMSFGSSNITDQFEIRFGGTAQTGDTIVIEGRPLARINTPVSTDKLESGKIIYW